MNTPPWSELGIVSNCWRVPLRQGARLEELVAWAEASGLRSIELRQGCLGDGERPADGADANSPPFPIPERLEALARPFPGLRFNLALDVPFLAEGWSAPFDSLIDAGIRAAETLSRHSTGIPHLRLVDLRTTAEMLRQRAPAGIVRHLVATARRLGEVGGFLSIENSRQPWQPFLNIFRAARIELGQDRALLRLCFDPCNLLAAEDRPDPTEATRQLAADSISMVHFKQRDAAGPKETLRDGEIDWRGVLAALRDIGYAGPALFEIESSERIRECVGESREWIESRSRE